MISVDSTTGQARPSSLSVLADAIPAELKARDQWVVWRYTWNPKKKNKVTGEMGDWDKPPLRADNGKPASSTNPATWTTFDAALSAYRDKARGFDGIGIVLTDPAGPDALHGNDLDTCRDPDTGEIAGWAMSIAKMMDTYTEVSPSGEGVHLIVCGHVDLGGGKDGRRKGKVELYRAGRYLTVTGHRVEGTPATIRQGADEALAGLMAAHIDKPAKQPPPPTDKPHEGNGHTNGKADVFDDLKRFDGGYSPFSYRSVADLGDDDLLDRGYRFANGDKLRALMAGDWTGFSSPSEAKMSLLNRLVWLTKHDADRVRRIALASGFAKGKWTDRPGLLTEEIDKAMKFIKDDYDPQNYGGSAPVYQVGDITLRPGESKKTPTGTIHLKISVFKGEEKLVATKVTNTATGMEKTAKRFAAQYGADQSEAYAVIASMLAAADTVMDENEAASDGPRLQVFDRDALGPALERLFLEGHGDVQR